MTEALFTLAALLLLLAGGVAFMIRMPGRSHRGPLPPRTAEEEEIGKRLRRTVEALARDIGERNVHRRYEALVEAAKYIEAALEGMGYEVRREEFEVHGKRVRNLFAECAAPGGSGEWILIGAHYDTVDGSPGANDNGSAVAACLETARAFIRKKTGKPLRFVFFVNEEYPYFMTPGMGSLVHAQRCKERGERIMGMLNLETIGCYRPEPKSQRYPFPLNLFYPSTGDFISFVGNLKSRKWVRQVVRSFRSHTLFPSEGIAAIELIRDIRRSDHYPFWREGYPALMVTDTANFRYAHYHAPTDTLDRIDFDGLSRVTAGLIRVIDDLRQDYG